VGELALLVIVVDEHGELGRFQHLDVHVGFPASEHRQSAGLGEDVFSTGSTPNPTSAASTSCLWNYAVDYTTS
jgi:hypothetical protein